MDNSAPPPAATIAIVTRDRREVLRNALASALAQEGSTEVVVIDDGSRDGTAAMVSEEFPGARLVHFDEPAGLAARRNDATAAARGDVIVSIDDDAVFSSTRTVLETLEDLDDPRIGVVAIPYIDVGVSPDERQRPPDPSDRWVTSIFRGTAYAIRREILTQIGGFDPAIVHQGEEWDVAMRLIGAGYVVRLGRADPIHHHASTHRDLRKMDVYGRRNELLISWRYLPAPWHLVYVLGYIVKGVHFGLRVGRPAAMGRGILRGIRSCTSGVGARRPIARAAFAFDRRSRSHGPVLLKRQSDSLPGWAPSPRTPPRPAGPAPRSAARGQDLGGGAPRASGAVRGVRRGPVSRTSPSSGADASSCWAAETALVRPTGTR